MDCYTIEFWLYTAFSGGTIRKVGTTQSYEFWQTAYLLPEWCYDEGVDFGGLCEATNHTTPTATDIQAARFTRGSFLLTWNRYKSTAILRGYPDPWLQANIADGVIGYPTSDESVIATNVHFRPFDNGWVGVNAGDVSWTGTVPGHGSQTIPAHDAIIHVGA